ncbi:MAG: PaaI family thioesterase [Candidatus Acidiferrum sp.]
MTAPERTRTFTWDDPLATAHAGSKMSGLESLRAMIAGKLARPPIAQAMDFALEEVSEGRAVFSVVPAEFHYNPIGVVHGGLAATLLDSAMACAIYSRLPAGRAYTTLELKVNFVRAVKKDTGKMRAVGTVIHLGGKVATAEGKMFDANDKLYAHATTTCLMVG